MRKERMVIEGVVILVCLIGGIFLWQEISKPMQLPTQSTKELKLSDFPESFKDNTLIIVGDKASDIEMQVANEILEYLETYGKTEEEMKIKCCVECIASFHPAEATKPHCGYFLTHSCKKVLNVSNVFDLEVFGFCEKTLNEKGFKITQEVIYPDGRKVCNLNIYYKPGYCKCPDGSTKIKKINELGEEKEICVDSLKIISYSKITDEDKRNFNLIVIGTPKTNPFFEEVYVMTNAMRVMEEFPGKSKGILEILPNPWNKEKAMLLVEGSDDWGVKAGSKILDEVRDIDKINVIIEWNGKNAVFLKSIPQDKYLLLSLHQEISGSPVMIDFPPKIHFNKESGILECDSCNFEINKELSAVILNTIELRESGGGGGGGIIPIYTLPDSHNLPFLMKIKYIDSNGTIYLSYANTNIVLKPKEYYTGKFEKEWMGHKVICNIRIDNHGLYSKDKIKLERREGEVYKKGEPITFSINAKVKLWTNELPFKIVNEKGESIKLKHSCDGESGSGFDQYCKNGKIVGKEVYQLCNFSKKWCYGCSDVIFQKEEYVNETFVWDQKEYVEITEECEGKIIRREIKKQVPEGKYQIIVNGKVIKEFIIK